MEKRKKDKIKFAVTFLIIVIAFVFVISIMLKYNVEGEKNVPFNISEIIVISSAEGRPKSENPENFKWNLDIVQYNDIYIRIGKNEEYNKNAYIESVTLENFEFTMPKQGNTRIYMPNSTEGSMFAYDDMYLLNRTLTYNGGEQDDMKTLEINSQGGDIIFRVANMALGEYVSNEDAEISHNGTLISKTNAKIEDIQIDLSFDIVIKTNIVTYRGNVKLKLPCGDIITEGTSQQVKKDFEDVIFKRENY